MNRSDELYPGQKIRPGLRTRVDRQSFVERPLTDDANPMGIRRPRLPLNTRVSRAGRAIAAMVSGSVRNGNLNEGLQAMDAEASPKTPSVDTDPTPYGGIPRPTLPVTGE